MYIKVTNGKPETYTIGMLRKDNPNTSFPRVIPESTLNAYNVFKVKDLAEPAYDSATHRTLRTAVELQGEEWIRGWSVVALTAEELSAKAERIKAQYESAIQTELDRVAKEKGYDSIISLCSYKTSGKSQWALEAQAGIDYRDAAWNYALVELGNYIASGTIPSLEDFIAGMPQVNWPA